MKRIFHLFFLVEGYYLFYQWSKFGITKEKKTHKCNEQPRDEQKLRYNHPLNRLICLLYIFIIVSIKTD